MADRTTQPLSPDDLELLARRAGRVKERPRVEDDDDATHWFAEFRVGGDRFAIPLSVLRSAMPLRLVTPLPLAPPHVLGVVRYLGVPICVVSLASLLGVRGWREDPSVLVVVELPGGRRLAFDSEESPRAVMYPQQAVERAWARRQGALAELSAPGGRLVTLLDLAELVARTDGEG